MSSVNWPEAIAVVAAGMGAGAVNTIAGSGSLITFPTLLAVGYSPVVANVSNNIGLVPGAISGVVAYRDELRGQGRRARQLAIGSATGAFDRIDPPVAFAVGRVRRRRTRARDPGGDADAAPAPRCGPRGFSVRSAGRAPHVDAGLLAPVVCFFTGIYGGYFGAAQGIILLATLGILLPDALARTNALKNWLALMVNATAAFLFVMFGEVAWLAVALIAVGSIAGAFLGARIGKRVPVPLLRGFIVCLGYGVAARLILT